MAERATAKWARVGSRATRASSFAVVFGALFGAACATPAGDARYPAREAGLPREVVPRAAEHAGRRPWLNNGRLRFRWRRLRPSAPRCGVPARWRRRLGPREQRDHGHALPRARSPHEKSDTGAARSGLCGASLRGRTYWSNGKYRPRHGPLFGGRLTRRVRARVTRSGLLARRRRPLAGRRPSPGGKQAADARASRAHTSDADRAAPVQRPYSRHFKNASALAERIAHSNSLLLTSELQFLKASSPCASLFSRARSDSI